MFGLIAIGELNNWPWLQHHSLGFSSTGTLWRNPVFVLGEFVAFVATVVLVQYLTRTIIAKMTAKELEAARNRDVLEAIINGMAEGLLFITNDGTVAICNPQARGWADKCSDTGAQNALLEDFPPVLVEYVKSLLAADHGVAVTSDSDKFNFADTQGRHIEAISCPVSDIDGHRLGCVIVGEDLTEHKKLEHELMERTLETAEINEMLKMSRIEMAQREKMVAIGQMAAGIAHEIGNPLASLSSIVQYLKRKTPTAEQDNQLGLIGKQVDRISMILKRMLSLSRPATSEYRWTDINTIVDNTLSLIRFDKRAKSVEVRSDTNHELPMVWLNPQHLEQVLLNIVTNALDAMIAKGPEQQHTLEVVREFKDEMVEIRVSDTGIGMSADVCRRAFESFFTTKKIGKGTGLGLYISYNLVTEIDGTINIDSEPGVGTTVTIRVPIRPKKHLISA
jgi:signal transduction histidine kinase